MMTPHLQQRFEQLIRFALNPAHNLTAYENIAGAREMVDTCYVCCDMLTADEYNEYRAEVTKARLVVDAAVMKRVDDSMALAVNQFDGARTDVVSVRGQQVEVSEFLRKPA